MQSALRWLTNGVKDWYLFLLSLYICVNSFSLFSGLDSYGKVLSSFVSSCNAWMPPSRRILYEHHICQRAEICNPSATDQPVRCIRYLAQSSQVLALEIFFPDIPDNPAGKDFAMVLEKQRQFSTTVIPIRPA